MFELTPTSSGLWKEKMIHYFGNNNGNGPYAGVTFDSAGNLYGTTYAGGILRDCKGNGCGVVFELSPSSTGWKQTRLYNFHDTDGANPTAGVIVDSTGHVWGTTSDGPSGSSCGNEGCSVAFELIPSSTNWTQTYLHVFGSVGDGGEVFAGLAFGPGGNLYGTSLRGGLIGYGAVY